METKNGHRYFLDFLGRELAVFDMTHWYVSYSPYGLTCDRHFIGKIIKTKHHFLFFNWIWKSRITIAEITAEPATPVTGGKSDAFRIVVHDPRFMESLESIAQQFELEGFGVKAELIY